MQCSGFCILWGIIFEMLVAGDVIFGLVLGEDIIGFGNRDAEQWMEKMLKDFPVLQKENSHE